MKWATRRHIHVDRAACAWLIRRFIDDSPEFVFVDDPDEVPPNVTAFDMRGVDLSHHEGRCSFETFLATYDLADPILWEIGQIIHAADLADERYDAPEAVGVDVLIRGLSLTNDDEAMLPLTDAIFDGLYEFKRQALMLGTDPS